MRTLLIFSTVAVSAMLVLVFGLSVAVSGRTLAGSSEDQKDAGRVNIDNFSFLPTNLTVPAGTKVTWTNRDDVPHNIISVEKKFASPVLDSDEEFSYSFNDPGTYEYYCSIHPKMTGKVIVQ